jgi:osmotically-inducible protein OsmY
MLKTFSRMLPIVALAWMLTGCQALTGETLGQNIDDTNLTAAVKTQLARDKVSSLTRIDVDTNRGVVSLNGIVESTEQRARAEQIARGVSGVRGVTNNLQVQREPTK